MSSLEGKNVLIVGLAKSGVACAKFLAKAGAHVFISDSKPEKALLGQIAELTHLKITYDLGTSAPKHLTAVDLIILSPGVPTDARFLDAARQKGTPITGELEFAAQFVREPIIAITGTNGKSTVSKLTYEFLRASGVNAWLGGNFGTPLMDYVLQGEKADALVVEVSSFQLETIEHFMPRQIAFLNFAEDHLDRYRSLSDYAAAKKRIFRNATRDVHAYLNADDPMVVELAKDPQVQRARLQYFSKRSGLTEQISKIGGAVLNGREIRLFSSTAELIHTFNVSSMKMKGRHSMENVMAALCLAQHYGLKRDAVQKVIDTFPGLEHRLEFVRSKGGVQFYNDSKSTNVHSLLRALEAFDEPVILIAGGKDKGMDFNPLIDAIQKKVKNLILVGEAKERLNRSLGDYSETFIIGTFEEAVLVAFQKSRNGDVILLSPGCSSYDMFENYEHRGNYFKELTNKL